MLLPQSLVPDPKRLAAVGVFDAGGAVHLLSANGRVLVFDTANVARNVLPLLGDGRDVGWDVAEETCWFTPLRRGKMNRACILTGYDPCHVPAGLPVRSETRGRAWKRHVHYTDLLVDKGQFARRADGTTANLAIGEAI